MSVSDFYNRVVDIESFSRTKDDLGSWSETVVKQYTSLRCSIQPRKGFESVVRGKEQSEVTHVMYCPVITMNPSWRVNHGGKYYDIVDSQDVAFHNRYLRVDLKEIVA